LDTDAQLFILDEPTTALSDDEVSNLFAILRRLKEQGKSIIFISHKMGEIFEIADCYTVLRNGEIISSGLIKDVTPHQVTLDMVGEQYIDRDDYKPRELGEVVLSLKGFSGEDFHNVNLEVRKGEIVAFTGLSGSGASELIQTMFGVLPSSSGEMQIKGKLFNGHIYNAMKQEVAMLPSNRKENSMVPDNNILENSYIAEHVLSWRKFFISQKKELGKFSGYKDMLQIKTESPLFPIESLSGGNQQKIFLARWLNIGAEILLFDNPTQGVDVGAKVEIYRLILEFAAQGKTVIINTLEIPEIKKVSDRCAVFYEGEIAKIFNHDEINEHDVMLYATNVINARKGGVA
jgi:ribose transport system ATP-binding protein